MNFPRQRALSARRFLEADVLLFILLLCAASGVLFAEENEVPVEPEPPPAVSLDKIFPGLREKVLVCTIEARVVEAGDEVAWQAADSKITISGRPVSLKLTGDNVVVVLQFTPYIRFGGPMSATGYLVVQGQIWANKVDGGMYYQGIMQSIPVSMGEKIHFLPLGPKTNRDESSIEILFEVRPYSEVKESTPKTGE
jgi:hypothetical protein